MISVIIPTYNNALILKRSLLTWMSQSINATDYEVIIVDNNSIDNTEEVVKELILDYPNYHYIKELKPGATNARHAGARLAKGEILVFADNDGLYNEDCLYEINKAFIQLKGIDALACKINILWDEEPDEWIKPYAFLQGELDYGPDLAIGNKKQFYFNGGLFAIKRDTFFELQGFNPDLIGGKLIGDGDTGLVEKVWDANKLIGWTPFAKMSHMQQVSKHGSREGVALHLFNNGVASSYALFRKNKFKFTHKVISHITLSILLFIKKWLTYMLFRRDEMKTYFSMNYYKGQVTFFLNLFNKDIREEVYKYNLL